MCVFHKMLQITTLVRSSQLYLRSVRSCSIQACLASLEKNINSDIKFDLEKSIKELENINPRWPHKQDGQKQLSSILYSLSNKKYYQELHEFVIYLESAKFDMWSGMSTIVLNAYIDQRLWEDAMALFEAMKSRDQIKHLRTYKRFLTALLADNQLEASFKYFSEFQEKEFELRSSRLDKPDFTMLMQIVKSLLLLKHDESGCDLNEKFVGKIIEYIDHWGILPPPDLVELLAKWYESQGNVVTRTILKDTQCKHCHANLRPSLPFESLCEKFVTNFRNSMISAGRQIELKVLDSLFERNETIDVIIDAANILFRGSLKNEKRMSHMALKEVVSNVKKYSNKSFFRVAVVFPQSLSKPDKLQQFQFIDQIARQNTFDFNLNVIALKRTNDDLVLFYLAARGELLSEGKETKPVIISQDNFYNHRFLFDTTEEQRIFFRWLSRRRSLFGGNYVSSDHNIEPIVRSENNGIHITDSRKNVMCIDVS